MILRNIAFPFCLVFYLLVSENCLYAQIPKAQISGYIYDSAGELLAGVQIACGAQQLQTNAHAYFSVRVSKGAVKLQITYPGYTDWEHEMNIDRDTLLTITLQKTTTLQQAVVRGRRNGNLFRSDPMGRLSFNPQASAYLPTMLGERDLVKNLQLLPGISAGTEGSSQLNIRGGGGDQTLILLDDVPVYNQNHAFGLLSVFSADVIKDIDVYQANIPAEYGGRLSGIVSMRMRDGDAQKARQSFSLGTLTAAVQLEGPIKKDKLTYMVSLRRSTIDAIFSSVTAFVDEIEAVPIYSFYDFSGKISWKINPKNRLYWNLYSGSDQMSILTKHKDVKQKAGYSWGTTTSALRMNSILSHNLFVNNSIYYSALNNQQFNRYNSDQEDNKNIYKSQLNEVGFRSSWEHRLYNNLQLLYGLELSNAFFYPQKTESKTNISNSKDNNNYFSLFSTAAHLSTNYQLGKWRISPGIRFSHFNSRGSSFHIEPRLAVNWQTDSCNQLMVAYTNTNQALIPLNQEYYSMPIDFWVPANDGRIAGSNQITLGWKNKSIMNLLLSSEVYYKSLRNMIFIYDREDYLNAQGGYSPASGKAYGVELMGQYTIGKWNMGLTYTYSKSRRTVDNYTFDFKYDSPHRINVYTSYKITDTRRRQRTISMNGAYQTGIPYTLVQKNYPSLPIPGESELPSLEYNPRYPNTRLNDYFRIDVNYTTEKRKKRGWRIWQLSLLNATSNQNQYMLYFDPKKQKYQSVILIPLLPSISYRRTF